MIPKFLCGVAALALIGADAPGEDLAAKFGALQTVNAIALSPDGKRIAYVGGHGGPATALWTVEVGSTEPRMTLAADGKPLQLNGCSWVAAQRLICRISTRERVTGVIISASRLVGVDTDGRNAKLVSQRQGIDADYFNAYGGGIVDLLPDEDGAVLIGRTFVPEHRIGTLIDKRAEGYGVDRLDTRTGKSERVEAPKRDAVEYISDGHGHLRIMGVTTYTADGYAGNVINYFYRAANAKDWRPFGSYDRLTKSGFNPYAVDGAANIVYGLKKLDGRAALYAVKLDETLAGKLILSNPSVDVDDVVTIGRDHRVVGATYATETRKVVYSDPAVAQLLASLHKALPALGQIDVVDSSIDRETLLIRAGSDIDPGSYFLFDAKAKRLNKIIIDRPQLDGLTLSQVRPITYPATDGTMVPGYLTLPPGRDSARGLPAIVLPHGGPDARDEWGFDWLSQYFAQRGYAVIQPNFRGSGGYGDAWFQKNGFRSWRVAVGDVIDAGRWLVGQGVDPGKLAIFGWSYGGYAALQSAVVAPDLFKAVVAVAPVTDFRATIEQARDFSNFRLTEDMIGAGPHLTQGSPAQNVAAIKAPVLMFHGDMDQNVAIAQSQLMDGRLRAAGKASTLVVYPGLTHSLIDGTVRADMLRRSDAFLRKAMGL